MTPSFRFKSPSTALRAVLLPLAALLVAMVSVQTGAALVKGLFPRVGVAGATTLRLALAAGACWALYIVFGQKAGALHGGMSTALGTVIAAIVITPVGLAQASAALFDPRILPIACAVALLSSALPYSLEMFALTRLPTRTFGVLMSAEPALGALSGWCFLQESLSLVQWAAVASIMLASAGSAVTSRGGAPPTA